MDKVVKCAECGKLLTDEDDVCPECGSNKKAVYVSISESIGANIHVLLHGKFKKPGIKGFARDFIHGDEKCISKNTWVKKDRVIDRENMQYTEEVKDIETGKVIHQCKEPLEDHQGHGSAKKKQK